jgi:hypothetical protein
MRMQNIFRTPVAACPIARGPSCDAPVTSVRRENHGSGDFEVSEVRPHGA